MTIIFVFTIILEIILAVILVANLERFNHKVINFNKEITTKSEEIIENIKQFRSDIEKINKYLKFISEFRFNSLKKAITVTLDILNIYFLLKTFDPKKGWKNFNSKNIRKILSFSLVKSFTFFCKKIFI